MNRTPKKKAAKRKSVVAAQHPRTKEQKQLLDAQVKAMDAKGYVTVEKAADMLSVHIGVVYRAVHTAKLASKHIGRRYYVLKKSLKAYGGPLIEFDPAELIDDPDEPPVEDTFPLSEEVET